MIEPEDFCKTCKTLEIYQDRKEGDHTDSNCQVVPFKPFKDVINKCISVIKDEKEKNWKSLKDLQNLMKDYRLSVITQIEHEFREMEMIINDFFMEENKELEKYVENIDLALINDDQLDEKLENIPRKILIIDELPKLSIKYDIATKNSMNIQQINYNGNLENTFKQKYIINNNNHHIPNYSSSIQQNIVNNLQSSDTNNTVINNLNLLNVNPSDSMQIDEFNITINKSKSMEKFLINSSEMTKNGLFFNRINENNKIFFKTFQNLPEHEILLDKDILMFTMTTNFIYAISADDGYLLSSQKPYGNNIKFQIISELKFSSIKAYERNVFQRYILSRDNEYIYLFVNDKLNWKIGQSSFIDLSLASDGSPIIQNCSQGTISFLDYCTGDTKDSCIIDDVEDIREFKPHGYLILRKDNNNEKYLYLYDKDMEINTKLIPCERILGISLSRFVCLTSTEISLYSIQ